MDWGDWFVFLSDQTKHFESAASWQEEMGGADWVACFVEADELTEAEARQAIRVFARRGVWMPMDPLTAGMVKVRLLAASDLALRLQFLEASIESCAPPLWPKHRLIRWFLLQAWEHMLFGQIAGNLEQARRTGTAHDTVQQDSEGCWSGAM